VSTGRDGTVNRKSFSRFLFLANETADEHLVPSDLQRLMSGACLAGIEKGQREKPS
jgi:hypothetical protein